MQMGWHIDKEWLATDAQADVPAVAIEPNEMDQVNKAVATAKRVAEPRKRRNKKTRLVLLFFQNKRLNYFEKPND